MYLGLDVGTTSTKVVLMSAAGSVLKTAAPAYKFQTPRAGWAESDPGDWWQATLAGIREVCADIDPTRVRGIGLTGQMHGLVLLDAAGDVLRPCIMWNDQRTAKQCREITEKVGAAEVLRITGNPVLPGFTAPKIAWVREHEPEVWRRTRHILLPKDYIRFRLSQAFATDVSDASGTSLLDVGRRGWSRTMLDALAVPEAYLPSLHEGPEVCAHLSKGAADLTGLPPGLPIVAGGGDQAAGAVGCGTVEEGLVSCSLGTSGVVFAHAKAFAPDPRGRLHAFCAAVPGEWHLMGVQLSCAGSYQWFHDHLGGGRSFEELNALAEAVPAGAEGLLFLPYLAGERTPHPDPHARGVFCGLSLRHGLGHLTRAVLEGVSFGLRDATEIMGALGIRPSRVIVTSGGARSALWRQILADMFGVPMARLNNNEGAAFGAALLAAVGTGAFPDVRTACHQTLEVVDETRPGPNGAAYGRLYPTYQQLYERLKPTFEDLAAFVG